MDEGLEPINISGRWVGFYRYRWDHSPAYPIVAEFVQKGCQIGGVMYDQVTDRSEMLEVEAEHFRDDLSKRQKQSIAATLQHYGHQAITVKSHLPDTSDIAGTVAGRQLVFTKSYRGAYEIEHSVGGNLIGSNVIKHHSVTYRGRLDPELGTVVGDWTIPHQGLLGWFGWVTRGSFELYRKT